MTEEAKPVKKKSAFREWLDSIVFAVVAATLIRWLLLEAYTIPSGSMENSLLVNDFLFVSKVHYGTRTPKTILQVPLTHQKIWFTNIPSYSSAIQLPQFRLPGFTSIKNNDVVVFNYPGCEGKIETAEGAEGYDKHPVDLRTNYIKRCIGIGGDKVEVREGQVYVNDKIAENPKGMLMPYQIEANTDVNEKVFEKFGIKPVAPQELGKGVAYVVDATKEAIEGIKTMDFITKVTQLTYPKGDSSMAAEMFPRDAKLFPTQNIDNFGPIIVPKEGMTVQLDEKNTAMYWRVIKTYDHNENVKVENGKIFIDGKQITSYTFKQNYYFMMGDNRHGSDDSRSWGFVPEDHVVGKAVFIWMSINTDGNWLNKIRWSRLFSIIK